jgi:hypothetical protein
MDEISKPFDRHTEGHSGRYVIQFLNSFKNIWL